jgi:hypothetical protein
MQNSLFYLSFFYDSCLDVTYSHRSVSTIIDDMITTKDDRLLQATIDMWGKR